MKLPGLKVIISSILLLSLFSTISPVYAQINQSSEAVTPINTGEPAKTASTGAVLQEKGDVKFLPALILVVGGAAITAYLFKDVIGKAIDCSKNLDQCVKDAMYSGENAVYAQIQGCDFEAPNANFETVETAYPEDSCTGQKIAAYLDGKRLGQVPNPGLMDVADGVLASSLSLPVPVSTGQYLASINPFKSAQAKTGAQDLASNETILDLWRGFQRAAFVLMVAILIIIGFMIMLRFKLDPRTVVTAQNALPRIVVSLILIAFSFGISGLMIDIVRLLTSLVVNTLGSGSFSLGAMITLIIASLFTLAGTVGVIGAVAGGATGWPIYVLVVLLLIAIIIALIFFVVFAVLITKIIVRYVTFILLTIFAPLFFLVGAIPGFEGIIFSWFRRTAAALLAIPATALFVHLSFRIGFSGFIDADRLPLPWIVPGFINGILQWTILGPAVGLGLFFFATKMPEIVDEAFSIRPLPRGGIGPGSIFIAPIGALGQVGRSFTGISKLERTLGYPNFITGRIGGFLKKFGCLPSKSLIDTPLGSMPINKLREGMLVWSANLKGKRVVARILRVAKISVYHHLVSHLILKDGREVFVSPDHPTADNRKIADLKVGSKYAGSIVIGSKLVSYKGRFTHDILPDSPTGHYWADGILMGSTLPLSPIKIAYTTFVNFFNPVSPG